MRPIEVVLDIARWAPSGDNSQPWRFEFVDDMSVLIHSFNLSKTTIQDYKGNYSQFGLGALLESIKLAGSLYGNVKIEEIDLSNPDHMVYKATISLKKDVQADPLALFITKRLTNRFAFSTSKIESNHKKEIASVLDEGWSLNWYETLSDKLKIGDMLTTFDLVAEPETSGIIDWNTKSSKFRLSDETLGLSGINLKLARFIFTSPTRTKWLYNRLGGKYSSAFLGFFLPAIKSGAHFTLNSPLVLNTAKDFMHAGAQFQKIWLKAAALNLSLQMESGPLIFSRYVRDEIFPYNDPQKIKRLKKLESKFHNFFGDQDKTIIMLSRIGYADPPKASSDRLSLEELKYKEDEFESLSI